MFTKRLYQTCFALLLGIAALAANGFEQQQLGVNIIAAAAQPDAAHASPFHIMPDGTVMAGSMGGAHHASDTGGHTHKGHADCDICGFVADMAGIVLPTLPPVQIPPVIRGPFDVAVLALQVNAPLSPPYSSRAPPIAMN